MGPVNKGYRDGTYIKGNADRIASVFDNAEIIIFVRNQVDLIASCYMQYIRNGGNLGINRYLHADENALFSLKYLDFYKVVKYYKSLFNKVHIFAYEDFRVIPQEFIDNFGSIFGFEGNIEPTKLNERVNPSIKPWVLPAFRFLNLFADGNGALKYQIMNIPSLRYYKNLIYHRLVKVKWLTAPVNPERVLGKKNVEFIRDYYSDSNAQMKEDFELEFINKYGYLKK
jgi:hypothetical protein